MEIPSDHNAQLTGPRTPEEAEFLDAYRDLDEANRVLIWSAMLTRLGRLEPTRDEESPGVEESTK